MSRIFDAVRNAERSYGKYSRSLADDPAAEAPSMSAAPAGSASTSLPATSRGGPVNTLDAEPLDSPNVPDRPEPSVGANPPADRFAVVGISWEAAGPDRNPRLRLAEALKKQLTRVNFRHTDMRPAIVYGNDQADARILPSLRKKYRANGRFCEFLFFSEASRSACEQFGIRLRVLDMVDEDAIPGRRIAVIHEPYFPGV